MAHTMFLDIKAGWHNVYARGWGGGGGGGGGGGWGWGVGVGVGEVTKRISVDFKSFSQFGSWVLTNVWHVPWPIKQQGWYRLINHIG